jgi:hypothetical protein
MSQASRSKAKTKHQQMLSSGEVDRGPGLNRSTTSSLPTATSRFSTRRAGVPPVNAPYKAAILKNNDAVTMSARPITLVEPWMNTVTPGKFAEFQHQFSTS